MQKTSLNPEIYQTYLDSLAPKAAARGGATRYGTALRIGQAQYFTPREIARILAYGLPRGRRTLCDLTCGRGDLIHGTSTPDTDHALGCDLDPAVTQNFRSSKFQVHALDADLTLFAPLLEAVHFRTDLMVLNPPWSLPWIPSRLEFLQGSDLPTVTSTYRPYLANSPTHNSQTSIHATEGRSIDSTLATLLLALHFLTASGEGFLIANTATVERLILSSPLAPHLWAHLIIPGNPCTPAKDKASRFETDMTTSILYFTRKTHPSAPLTIRLETAWAPDRPLTNSPTQQLTNSPHSPLTTALQRIQDHRRTAGLALNLHYQHSFNQDAPRLWKACQEEWQRLQSTAPGSVARAASTWNLWLDPHTGTIQTHLSLFEEKSNRTLARQAVALHKLDGKTPFTLVTQRAERDILLQAVGTSSVVPTSSVPARSAVAQPARLWRVDPILQAAVRQAVADYHAARAPLYSLPKIQRLGYLDEEDTIQCEKDLFTSPTHPIPNSKPHKLFQAGRTYPLRTRSVPIKRIAERYNPLNDEMEKIEYTGSELATFITADNGEEYTFMESRLRDPAILLDPKYEKGEEQSTLTIHFTLQDLAEHFIIPEVPDIAAIRPDAYQAHLATIVRLTTALSSPS